MSLPTTARAIVVEKRGTAVIKTVPVPVLRDDYLLIKIHYITNNSTDWKSLDRFCHGGERLGCDYAGTVLQVGPGVKKPFKVGDRAAGFVHGASLSQHQDGTFREIIVAKGDLQIKVPDHMKLEDAAAIGTALVIVYMALYQKMHIPPIHSPPSDQFILINGGSSANDALAVQYSTLSGLRVITTCSPHNFGYLKSLGADLILDYKSSSCAAEIREFTQNKLVYAMDCFASDDNSLKLCAESLSSTLPSQLMLIIGKATDSKNPVFHDKINLRYTNGFTIFGEDFTIFNLFQAKPDDYAFGVKFIAEAEVLLAKGLLKPQRIVLDQPCMGLEGALNGVNLLRSSRCRGQRWSTQ